MKSLENVSFTASHNLLVFFKEMTHVKSLVLQVEVCPFQSFPKIGLFGQFFGLPDPEDGVNVEALGELRRRVLKAKKESRSAIEVSSTGSAS